MDIFATYAYFTAPTTRGTLILNTKAPSIDAQTHNCKMQFFILSNTSIFTFSSLSLSQLRSFERHSTSRRKKHTHMRTHKHVHSNLSLSLSVCLSRYEKLSLDGGRKRQQRERKYKCSANGFCGDVTVASVGDRWKR